MRVETKEQVFTTLYLHRQDLKRFGIRACGVFGSFVRNKPQHTSDIDILIEFEPEQKTFDNFMKLAFFLEDILERPVDLVTKDALSPYIGPHILREVEYVPLSA